MILENYMTHGEYLDTIELAYRVKKILCKVSSIIGELKNEYRIVANRLANLPYFERVVSYSKKAYIAKL